MLSTTQHHQRYTSLSDGNLDLFLSDSLCPLHHLPKAKPSQSPSSSLPAALLRLFRKLCNSQAPSQTPPFQRENATCEGCYYRRNWSRKSRNWKRCCNKLLSLSRFASFNSLISLSQKSRMDRTIDNVRTNFSSIRTGRANPSMLDKIQVYIHSFNLLPHSRKNACSVDLVYFVALNLRLFALKFISFCITYVLI